ncbi:MAG: penicillin acylase family protein [Vicinamibacteria bacterium]
MRFSTASAPLLTLLAACAAEAQGPAIADATALAKAALAQIDGTVMLSGTREPVEVIRDKFVIPHIYAKNTGDLFFAAL